MLRLPRWCAGCCYYFALEERLKDAEREVKIRKMGMDCSDRLGSASPPNEAIIHFPTGAGQAAAHRSAPRLEAVRAPLPSWGLITPRGPSQPAPTPPSALVTRREGSLATCDPGHSMCTGGVSIGAGPSPTWTTQMTGTHDTLNYLLINYSCWGNPCSRASDMVSSKCPGGRVTETQPGHRG